MCELFGANLELVPFLLATTRERGDAATAIVRVGFDADESLGFEAAQQPAQIARVEAKAGTQIQHLGTASSDLEQQARWAEWTVLAMEAFIEHADALGELPVEVSKGGNVGL